MAPLAEIWSGESDRVFPLGVALLALGVEILQELEQVEAWTKMEEWSDGERTEKETATKWTKLETQETL